MDGWAPSGRQGKHAGCGTGWCGTAGCSRVRCACGTHRNACLSSPASFFAFTNSLTTEAMPGSRPRSSSCPCRFRKYSSNSSARASNLQGKKGKKGGARQSKVRAGVWEWQYARKMRIQLAPSAATTQLQALALVVLRGGGLVAIGQEGDGILIVTCHLGKGHTRLLGQRGDGVVGEAMNPAGTKVSLHLAVLSSQLRGPAPACGRRRWWR